ncbi:hypothetical protein LCGC14_1841260 [marine sediment metagenome]|uniref:Terminase large subunit gp17-like C-terminal domain-containing protein n=1 Tax=marine sediment metagenome TaxID=412755 RepID=A0A0F9GDC3_9ZZZZ
MSLLRSPLLPGSVVSRRYFSTAINVAERAGTGAEEGGEGTYRVEIKTKEELRRYVGETWGVWIPDEQCCEDHQTPMDAFAASYFAEDPVVIWHASRGLGGKTVLLALLSLTEATTLGAGVTLLGGSGEQSVRVLEYMQGLDPNLLEAFWNAPNAPRELLRRQVGRRTRLRNGGQVTALMASTRSVRGPHPQRVRLDEADEMDMAIYTAATGQAMGRVDEVTGRRVAGQMTVSSTWHEPDGTMTFLLKEARKKRWPVFQWCYKENLRGWLSEETLAEKRAQVTTAVFEVEFDLQEPSPERRVMLPEALALTFKRMLGEIDVKDDWVGELVFEEPAPEGLYATGTDWAKDVDWTWILTYRVDRHPIELVAIRRSGRMPWPVMVEYHCERVKKYGGQSSHDATGVGKVVADYLTVDSEAFTFVGKERTDLLSSYIQAMEHGKIVNPVINLMYAEHKFADNAALFSATKHLPDTIAAGALAWRAAERARGADIGTALKARRRARKKMRER